MSKQSTRPDLLTVDTTVAWDFLYPQAQRHGLAKELFGLAREGVVELLMAEQGHIIDATPPGQPIGTPSDLGNRLRAMFSEPGVAEADPLAHVSPATAPSPFLVPGHFVRGFDDAWRNVIASWRPHEGKPPGDADSWHVETHVIEQRDVFVTDDAALIVMCRRLRHEHGLPVVAMRLGEYLDTSRASRG